MNMSVSDIQTFFYTSTRSENDATNKIREKCLLSLCEPPKAYLEHPDYGRNWAHVSPAWNDILKKLADTTGITDYQSIQIKLKGGRKFNYDAEVMYKGSNTIIRHIDFKNGETSIAKIPQILSLQAKFDLFAETYDKFWYEHYLDKYIGCDDGIALSKPPLPLYLKRVTRVKCKGSPFFEKLSEREFFFQNEKNDVVNASITDYLTRYGHTINLPLLTEKIRSTQNGKYYILWNEGAFHMDWLHEEEMGQLTYLTIKNGNVIQVKSGNTIYNLLLRWRNHKGILNPAWQISMNRL